MLRRCLSPFPIAAVVLAGFAGGCVGKISDASSGSTSTPPGGNTAVGITPGGNTPGVASVSYAMVRLTNTQYLNTAHDLLAMVSFPEVAFVTQ